MTAADREAARHILPALRQYMNDSGIVRNYRAMPDGHAGLTYGFELEDSKGNRQGYIFKKAPDGVPRGGSTDIFRQAQLLRSLHAAGFPAPDVRWAGDSTAPFGAPFIIMHRLPGRSIIVWDPDPELLAEFRDVGRAWTETARLMGSLHRLDWQTLLADWEEPTDLSAELDRWTRLLRHMQDMGWRTDALKVADRLRQTQPEAAMIGLIHGDLQPGNVLFKDGRATGLIDWDLAAIGPLGLDVGWLMMIADPECWAPEWSPDAPPARAILLNAYRDSGGMAVTDVDWHQAFAAFRMAAITGLNLKLHRDGRRHDPVWERFAASLPFLLGRARALLVPRENET